MSDGELCDKIRTLRKEDVNFSANQAIIDLVRANSKSEGEVWWAYTSYMPINISGMYLSNAFPSRESAEEISRCLPGAVVFPISIPRPHPKSEGEKLAEELEDLAAEDRHSEHVKNMLHDAADYLRRMEKEKYEYKTEL